MKGLSSSANELGGQDIGRIVFVSIEITNKYSWSCVVESESETGTKFLKDQEGIEGTVQ